MYCTGMNLSNDTGDMGRIKVHQIHITCSDSESVFLEEPSSHSTSKPAKTPIFRSFHLSTNEATGQKKTYDTAWKTIYICVIDMKTRGGGHQHERTSKIHRQYTPEKPLFPTFMPFLKLWPLPHFSTTPFCLLLSQSWMHVGDWKSICQTKSHLSIILVSNEKTMQCQPGNHLESETTK